MNRIVRSALLAGLGAVALASTAARADQHFTAPVAMPVATAAGTAQYASNGVNYGVQFASWGGDQGREQRDLDAARSQYFAHGGGDRRDRARFESWYARRGEELRQRSHGRNRYERDSRGRDRGQGRD